MNRRFADEKKECLINGRLNWKNKNQEKKMGVGQTVDLTQRWKRWVFGE